MNEEELLKICFLLAEDLMWEKDTAPLEKMPEQLAELSEMTNKFIEIPKRAYYHVEAMPDGEEIMFGALGYLHLQAMPPLRGDYEWFSNTLDTILEICNPNCIPGKEGIPFLLHMQKGIIRCMEQSIQGEDNFN